MSGKKAVSLICAALAVMLLGGAGFAEAAPTPTKTAKPAQPDPALIAKGAKLWADNCGRCHNIRPATDFDDNGWEVVVTHMRVRANLPGKDAKAIKAFLKSSNTQ